MVPKVDSSKDREGAHFRRMFRYCPNAGSRMLKATHPSAGTSKVATRAALLSLVALTTVSAACTMESSA